MKRILEVSRDFELGLRYVNASKSDRFDISRSQGKYSIESSFGLNEKPEVAFVAQQVHGRSYVEYGYFDRNSLDECGRLVEQLDGTRERDDTAFYVTYLLAVPKNAGIYEAEATVRLLDINPRGGSIDDLPTYKYYGGAFSETVTNRLGNIINRYGQESVREVAALGVTGDHASSYELMRALVQNAVMNEADNKKREVFIASLTNSSLRPVLDFCGAHASEIIGDPVRIFTEEERAGVDLHVTPVLIEPCRIIDGVIDDIETASSQGEEKRLVSKFLFLTDGLSTDHLSPRATSFCKYL